MADTPSPILSDAEIAEIETQIAGAIAWWSACELGRRLAASHRAQSAELQRLRKPMVGLADLMESLRGEHRDWLTLAAADAIERLSAEVAALRRALDEVRVDMINGNPVDEG